MEFTFSGGDELPKKKSRSGGIHFSTHRASPDEVTGAAALIPPKTGATLWEELRKRTKKLACLEKMAALAKKRN